MTDLHAGPGPLKVSQLWSDPSTFPGLLRDNHLLSCYLPGLIRSGVLKKSPFDCLSEETHPGFLNHAAAPNIFLTTSRLDWRGPNSAEHWV